ncbi:hypothetical protein FQR65_LT16052 [Abscondita terminalis]|nr:hypothetical protein FQR65_LT16052 [Abscondita terminalis]
MEIGEYIRIKRENLKVSQEAVAFKLDMSQAAYSKIERGETKVKVDQIKGVVTDQAGKPLPSVSVFVQNSTSGTSTNMLGQYELKVSKEEKNRTLVFQNLGYKTQIVSVQINEQPHIMNVRWKAEERHIGEVVVTDEGGRSCCADYPAGNCITTGLLRVKKLPKKILGQKIDDDELALDTSRTGVVYLSETVSEISFQKPDKINEHIIASKVSGDDKGFSFNTAYGTNFDFYANHVTLGSSIVSPLANAAFSYYKFNRENVIDVEPKMRVHKIKVTPVRGSEPVVKGYIYIVDGTGEIYGEPPFFTRMSALAQQYGALNLSQGFPDYAPDPQLLSLVEQAMQDGHHQYALMTGVPLLRERIANKVEQLYQVNVDPTEEITVTAGGTQAIFTAIASAISPDDEVIIFEPAYDCYKPTIELFGELVTDKTKMIIINNPNNPTGRVLQPADLTALCHIVEGTDILIISDEVYEHLVYDGGAIHSLLEYEQLRRRSFIIASFGKLLHTTGWKIGYCIAPVGMTKEFRKVHQFNVFSVNTPMQYAIAKYLEDPQTYLSLPSFFQEKRDLLAEGLKDTGFEVIPSQGTYFLNVCYSRISELPEEEFAIQLTKDNGIAMIPVSAFYSVPRPRFEKVPVSVYPDQDTASKVVAKRIADIIRAKQENGEQAVLGLATGATPVKVYAELIRLHKEEGLSFKNVVTFNLDEYYPMQPDAAQSYVTFMNNKLFDHVDIDKANINIPDGTLDTKDVQAFCAAYEQKITDCGGLDIQILGCGGGISSEIPATYLQLSDSVEFILDTAAASLLTRFDRPWLAEDVEWTPELTKKAVVWLALEVKKPILKLQEEDYNSHGMAKLDLPFYDRQKFSKNVSFEDDIVQTMELLRKVKPHQIFAAGDFADPHRVHTDLF